MTMDDQGSTETVSVSFYVETLETELAAAQSRAVRLTALTRELQAEVARLRRVNEALQEGGGSGDDQHHDS